MITNEVQYHSTKAHLRRFDEAAAAWKAKLDSGDELKLGRLELDAVHAQADDLRAQIDEYDQLRSGAVLSFESCRRGPVPRSTSAPLRPYERSASSTSLRIPRA